MKINEFSPALQLFIFPCHIIECYANYALSMLILKRVMIKFYGIFLFVVLEVVYVLNLYSKMSKNFACKLQNILLPLF